MDKIAEKYDKNLYSYMPVADVGPPSLSKPSHMMNMSFVTLKQVNLICQLLKLIGYYAPHSADCSDQTAVRRCRVANKVDTIKKLI